MPEITRHTGLLIVPLSPKAYLAGIETGIVYAERLKNGDWFNYTPTDEKQYTSRYDTMSCTTFSAMNSLEMQINWLIKNDKIKKETLALLKEWGFFDEDGKFNCSDWFTANMAGTTENGNDFGSVWDSIRKHGVLPQKDGYQPSDFKTLQEWLDRTKVTTEMKEKALKFLEVFDVAYEFVLYGKSDPAIIAYHLKQAPIHIGSPTCNWGGGIIQSCGEVPISHATCAHGSEDKVATLTYDHYNPMNKKLAWDYHIPYAVKGLLSIKAPKPVTPPFKYTFTKTLKRGDRGAEVAALQKALKHLGFFTLGETTDFFGFYTEQAVKAFQAKYASEILAPWGLTIPTGKFASMSIKKLNQLLNG